MCVPTRATPCGADEIIEIDYPDKGVLWVPSETRCGGTYDLVVMLHGINPRNSPTPLLHGGLRLEELLRALIDGENITPMIIAAPVHFQAKSDDLYGEEYDIAKHLELIRAKLEPRNIHIGTISFTGHSGSGCHEKNGMYKVLDQIEALTHDGTSELKLWGIEDVCYEAPYHWDAPTRVLSSTGTHLFNMYSVQGDPAEFETNVFSDEQPFGCDASLYRRCIRQRNHPWCSVRTVDISHENTPYYFVREVFPQVFSGNHGMAGCWE